jgi:hypothetical protein
MALAAPAPHATAGSTHHAPVPAPRQKNSRRALPVGAFDGIRTELPFRAEAHNLAKQTKKEEKLRRREERKSQRETEPEPDPEL